MSTLDRPTIRRILDAGIPTFEGFEAFVIDFFPEVRRRFSSGMSRTAQTNLLLAIEDTDSILAALLRLAEDEPRLSKELQRYGQGAGVPTSVVVPPEPHMWPPSEDPKLSIVVLYADEDSRFYERMRKHMSGFLRSEGVSLWSPDEVAPGQPKSATIQEHVAQAAVLIVLLSADFFASNLMDSALALAFSRRNRGDCQILPVLVRSVSIGHSPFADMQVLPLDRQPIYEQRDQDRAWVEVIKAIQTTLEYQPQRVETNLPLGTQQQQPKFYLGDIFMQSGRPEHTYVEPAELDDLVAQLRMFGRVLVVEGPSGIGKTTAVMAALKVLGVAETELHYFRSTDEKDLASLDALVKTKPKGHIVVDDFHYLEGPWPKRLALAMQSAATAPKPAVKFTAIGVAQVQGTLIQQLPNLEQRLECINLGRQPPEKLGDLIAKGERAANVQFQRRAELINESMGSFSLLSNLCYRVARKAGVKETRIKTLLIPDGPEAVRSEMLSSYKEAFNELLGLFVRFDKEAPGPRGVGLILLWLLSSQGGKTSIQTACDRYPQLAAALNWAVANRLGDLIKGNPQLRELFQFTEGKTLRVIDPRVSFYLRFLDWRDLLFQTGLDALGWSFDDGVSGGELRSPSIPAGPPPQTAAVVSPAVVFPDSLVQALRNNRLIPFVGAGVSRAVKEAATGAPLFPSWSELLEKIAQRLVEQNKPNDAALVRAATQANNGKFLIEAASNARSVLGGEWGKLLNKTFDRPKSAADPASLELARTVWGLGSKLILTTNYDRVLYWTRQEDEFSYWSVTSRYEQLQLLKQGSSSRPTVWHLHGYIEHIEDLILTADGYYRLYANADPEKSKDQEKQYQAALHTLRSLLTTHTFLFIGFSFTDPWFSQQVEWLKSMFGDSVDRHYVLVTKKDQVLAEERLIRNAGLPLDIICYEDHGAPLVALLHALASRRT